MTEYRDDQYVRGVYTNHEGITAIRTIANMRIEMKWTQWHGWAYTLIAWDKDRQAERDFALNGWDFTAEGIAQFERTHPTDTPPPAGWLDIKPGEMVCPYCKGVGCIKCGKTGIVKGYMA